jgi:PTH1 family peptidyl-tRNA hydrolase
MAAADGIRLIAGLGNPGLGYESTRHNAGFWFVDALAESHGLQWRLEPRFSGEAARLDREGASVWLFKPCVFMNRSGSALRSISVFYKIPLARILVVHDEIDLPPGGAKLKRGGGHGGHNGLRDIFAHLGQDFWRLRLGVGHPGHKDQVIDYVLAAPGKVERQAILNEIETTLPLAPMLIAGEFEKVMHRLHTRA